MPVQGRTSNGLLFPPPTPPNAPPTWPPSRRKYKYKKCSMGSTSGCGSKIGTQNGTQANGNINQNLRSPGTFILTYTRIIYKIPCIKYPGNTYSTYNHSTQFNLALEPPSPAAYAALGPGLARGKQRLTLSLSLSLSLPFSLSLSPTSNSVHHLFSSQRRCLVLAGRWACRAQGLAGACAWIDVLKNARSGWAPKSQGEWASFCANPPADQLNILAPRESSASDMPQMFDAKLV